eukprot:m.273106 g.273106  ORF g.273106 m.273106 type:complete len:252 (-) comp19753_c0_seq4:276-1031(-)
MAVAADEMQCIGPALYCCITEFIGLSVWSKMYYMTFGVILLYLHYLRVMDRVGKFIYNCLQRVHSRKKTEIDALIHGRSGSMVSRRRNEYMIRRSTSGGSVIPTEQNSSSDTEKASHAEPKRGTKHPITTAAPTDTYASDASTASGANDDVVTETSDVTPVHDDVTETMPSSRAECKGVQFANPIIHVSSVDEHDHNRDSPLSSASTSSSEFDDFTENGVVMKETMERQDRRFSGSLPPLESDDGTDSEFA